MKINDLFDIEIESFEVQEGDPPYVAASKIIEQINRAFGPLPEGKQKKMYAHLHDFLVIHNDEQVEGIT